MDIVDRVFYLLKERKITAKYFAEQIGVSTGNVSDWKSGKARPGIDALVKIARFFEVSTDYLLGLEDK